MAHTRTSAVIVPIAGALGVVAIGAVDYASGVELRVFPLYYAPISFVAWYRGRSSALLIAALCALSWVVSNYLAGLRFSHPGIWVANIVVQAASFVIIGHLIAVLRAALGRERELSRLDPLTSLLNTRAFYEDAARLVALCRRKHRPVTLAYIDLDNFKTINDTLGHEAGDDVLRRVGELLRSSLRASDLPARLGGDEFAILLPEVEPDDANRMLERLRASFASTLQSDSHVVTSSIGAVTFLEVPEHLETMVQEADFRMYVAKSGGKDRVHFGVVGRGLA